ncbi:hypothetical protein AUEXF2481DRAFT_41322 [Aureobasidium subglaciale EXF-2481]|uniref:DNA-binding protein RAP1 n=1 Tax=Aureobasidium subglaciale (strain EXF-2481) TaxID=1043005 RepID=A0A074Y8R5_AURSE|nr:uncharacterized protein AUEXF2481DRAFT_41322 [Aureobasidium subglaciale EXF-2481]KAI5208403.1 hypothetical protein E4T38_02879 [Aureobasidium subglaciale]KAI5227289.1 hypothetical protein E4T40_02684 [Aureobasidium subglaciale]KAI5230599.1 hypothetical protein E4T41_02878 [Aureobasidium subglaciale]KAI5264902.1 hypothetical protein E4T46_02656 [Aureobasidium subglaciale]KEQ94138.1 hypothetical protein AUEXF2481DRAFT_41322 [Aureobasidium subglaciale EXF-2481]
MANPTGIQRGVFADKKFFIVQRVPQRSHFISLVEGNGGRVVKLEAQADYLIADHMRPDAPAGSLSYKFIDEVIKKGEIPEDESTFLANRSKPTKSDATAGASSSKKATRTAFTDDDDKMLYKWVAKAHEEGLALQGNKLYQQLAAHNDRHTYHSWRDRYIKVLEAKPPAGWEDYPDERLPGMDAPITDLSSTALPRSTATLDRSSISPRKAHTFFTDEDDRELQEWVSRFPTKPRVPFTEEDDRVLSMWVEKAQQRGEPLLGNELYKKLAAKNPRHSYHSWRDRWIKHVSLRVSIDEMDEAAPVQDDIPSARPSPSPSRPFSRPPVRQPGFRVPPAASASAESPINGEIPSIAPRPATSPRKLVTSAAPQASASASAPGSIGPPPTSANSGEEPKALAEPVRMTRPADSTSQISSQRKAQSNSTISRTNGSPAKSQPVQSRRQPSSVRHRSTQTDLESRIQDDLDFTKQEFESLLSVAIDIQNVCVGRYQESWIAFAKSNPTHSAVEWRSFYERRVLPVALQRENDPEYVSAQDDQRWIAFWQNQAQPIETLPYQKQDWTDEDKETLAVVEVEITPRASKTDTKTENDVVDVISKRKVESLDAAVEPEQTPKRQRTIDSTSAPARLPAAQLLIQGHDAGNIITTSSQVAPSPSYHSNTDEEMEDEEIRDSEVQDDEAAEQLQREMAENKDKRHQLTRANLARIQAENGSPEEQRGIDIERDDDNDDQGHFADYLGELLPAALKARLLETAETKDDQHDDDCNEDDDSGDDEDDDMPITRTQHDEEQAYDPAMLEVDPNLDVPSYQSSAEFATNNTQLRLDVPETQPWEVSSAPSQTERHRLSTQAMYDIDAQSFDADIPDPPSDVEEDTTPHNDTDSQILADDECWPWIDSQIALSFPEDVVKEALRATSFNPKLAAEVLQARGGRVNLAGVWTSVEDDIAEGGDAGALRALEEKHGVGSVMKRLAFLRQWREDEEAAAIAENKNETGK